LFCRQDRIRALPLALAFLHFQGPQAVAGALERAMLGKSTVVDLTHAVTERSPSPDAQDPRPQEAAGNDERNASNQRPVIPRDLGTHLEAPPAAVRGKATVAQIPARNLLVHAVVVDISDRVARAPDYRATVDDLQAWERRHGRIPRDSAVLLHTGWARRWRDRAQYVNLDGQGVSHVPGFSPAAIAFLVSQREIRGVGLDALAPRPPAGTGTEGANPHLLTGKWQLVNLTNLDLLPAKGAKLVIAPLRLEADSAPARVIAILP
jgi:kynurenine formamidase